MNSVAMGRIAFVCLAFLVLKVHGKASKCDPEIIDDILTFWSLTGGPPTNVLKDLESLGRGALVASTYNDHITSKNLTDPECVYADITTTSATFSVVVDKNSIETNIVKLTEKDGVISLEEEDRDIYIIVHKDGTTVYYTCSKTGEKGSPEGAVAFALKNSGDAKSKKLTNFEQSLLLAFGIEIDYEFSEACYQ